MVAQAGLNPIQPALAPQQEMAGRRENICRKYTHLVGTLIKGTAFALIGIYYWYLFKHFINESQIMSRYDNSAGAYNAMCRELIQNAQANPFYPSMTDCFTPRTLDLLAQDPECYKNGKRVAQEKGVGVDWDPGCEYLEKAKTDSFTRKVSLAR